MYDDPKLERIQIIQKENRNLKEFDHQITQIISMFCQYYLMFFLENFHYIQLSIIIV